ncbi:unnamed protein product [Microthlaspi erraticum]|uniref:Uncharacterized protein n=1 Tax=Microthlaspi erraticum TaxID=1685480 RepID=A0A6D2JIC2_9BRAS|nr:unnamed protein product [Microthlaspi erraticum]
MLVTMLSERSGQRKEKKLHVIYYASRTLDEAQCKYATTEKELLAYLLTKKDAKPRLLRWILLLQEFDLEIKDKKGIDNGVADHLSRMKIDDDVPLDDSVYAVEVIDYGEPLLADDGVRSNAGDRAQREQITRRHHARACEPAPLLPGLGVEEQRHPAQVHVTDGRLDHTSLRAVGFTPDREEEVAPPEGLGLEYLRNSVFLQKTSDERQLLYQFVHLQLGASRMMLPSPSWTTIRGGSNVEFNPPQSALYTGDRPSARDYATAPATTHRGDRSHAELDTTQTDELDHFHFAGYTTTARQSAGLKAAHQHISILQRWNKTQTRSPASSRAR